MTPETLTAALTAALQRVDRVGNERSAGVAQMVCEICGQFTEELDQMRGYARRYRIGSVVLAVNAARTGNPDAMRACLGWLLLTQRQRDAIEDTVRTHTATMDDKEAALFREAIVVCHAHAAGLAAEAVAHG